MAHEEGSPDKLIRATGFSFNEEALRIVHEEGEFSIPWPSVAHAIQVILDRKITAPLPLFIVHLATSDCFYYMDRNSDMLSSSEIQAEGEPPAAPGPGGADTIAGEGEESGEPGAAQAEQQELTLPEVEKKREELFFQSVTEMCSHIPHAAQHESLLSYLRGSRVFIPQFAAASEILQFCLKTAGMSSDDPAQGELHSLPDELIKGKLIDGKYTILDIFATSSKTTYIVLDPDYQIFFTLKTLPTRYARDASMTERFVRQARAWTALEPHAHLEKAELLKLINGRPYVFTEYVQGKDLESMLRKESLSIRSIIQIGIQAADGLHHAFSHSRLLHRDLRLSHFFITEEQALKITNPGLTAMFDDILRAAPLSDLCRRAEKGEMAADQVPLYRSLPFMAPELFTSINSAGVATDIYSLGAVLYTLLTSSNPFASSSPAKMMSNHMTRVPVCPDRINPRIPPPLAALVMKCLDKDPARRFGNFLEISAALKQIYTGLTGEAFEVPCIETEPGEDYWINEALALKSVNKNREALEALEEALAINPGSLRALFYKGAAPKGRAPGTDEKEWHLWFWKGESLKKSGDRDGAERCYDKALSLNESSEILWAQKARLLAEKGTPEDALKCYDRALFWNPRAADIWDQKGTLLLKMKNHRESLKCFREALEFCPAHKWIRHHLGMALFNLGSSTEAAKTFQGVIELDPAFYSAWIWLGDCYNELENRTGAIDAYESAIALQHTNVEAYLCCIQALKEGSLWEQALEYVDRALEFNPDDPDLALEHGEILLKLHYYDDARVLCEELLKDDPRNHDGRLIFDAASRLGEEQGRVCDSIFATPPVPVKSFSSDLNSLLTVFCSVKKSISFLESLEASDGLTCYLKGCLYSAEGDYEKALTAITRALDDPAQKERAQKIKGRIDEAMEKLGLVPPRKKDFFGFAKNPKKSESPDDLLLNGLERLRASDYQKARIFFRDTYTQNPSMLSCIYFMGQAFEQEGDLEKARHYYGEFGNNAPLSIGFCLERIHSDSDAGYKELETTYHRLLGSYPHQIALWVDYFRFLMEKKRDERVCLLASFLLREPFKDWDYLAHTPQYWNVTGFLQVLLGRYLEAKESFLKAQQPESENIPAQLGLGACLEGSGQFEEAIEHFKSLLIREETCGIASYLLSDIFLKQKQDIKASNTIEKALEKFGGSLAMLYKKAQIHAHLKMFPELEEIYVKIIGLDKRFAPVRVLQGKALCEMGKPDEGLGEMTTALSCTPGNMAVMNNIAFIHLQMQDHEKALAAFTDISEGCTPGYETCMGSGIVYYRQKNFEKACGFFERALVINPHEPELWMYLGASRFHLGNHEDALRCLDNSLSCRSRYAPGWLNQGAFHYCTGRYRDAEESIGRALALSPHSLPALLLMAKCRWRLGNQEEAVEFVQKAVALHGQSVKGLNLAGIFDFYKRNYAASFRHFDRAAAMEKNSPEIWLNRALSAFYTKKYDTAKDSLEKARALQPDRAETMIALCMVARVNNDLAGHTAMLGQIQQKYPEKYMAWSEDYQRTHDPLSYLKPAEIAEDPFTLPPGRPLALIHPLGLFHLLESTLLF